MKTKCKNAIFAMIEAMNDTSIHNYQIESVRQSRNEDNTLDWSFSVFQVEFEKETGAMRYREHLSNPAEMTVIADAMLAGSYVSVDTIGRKPEDWDELKKSPWGKPYIRFY